ncbi:response regulator [Microvirga sp. BT689]|uniref:response regulator n=1 Tax=Microvirga arvi TaxID=2778731 RepID=UPI001951EDC4|nr:response regulator [Microvirga arvi]MBM6578720.1 response regulator [Microvirga arvi]
MRILILEDDPAIAFDLQAILEAEGHEVIDSISSLAEAYQHLDDVFDCALLDIDVIGGKSFGVAETLMRRHIPFVFVSASTPSDLPQTLQQVAFVAKPFEERVLLKTVERAVPSLLPC